ncbi:MAG: hypothetical protein RQ723_04135 [Desulfuromonadales bacterium]|nr:hypothetical protein [Desulfuromonadales bacterium]
MVTPQAAHISETLVRQGEPVQLDDLARSLNAYKSVDASAFQRRARVLQSMWREEQGFDPGEHAGAPLGSRLRMPEAQEQLLNYITPTARDVVKREVLGPAAKGKLYGKPRIFNDLLSSQPLCFNLFGELTDDLALASDVIRDLTGGRFSRVTAIEFEESPGRGDPRYLNDRSAFDVFVRCEDAESRPGFIGIEVKYHENLQGPAAEHKPRYDEVADAMACFVDDRSRLRQAPIQQIWRDHLLAGITLIEDGYVDGMFATLYPADNTHVSTALADYRQQLVNSDSFDAWTMEQFVTALRRHASASWIDVFEDRYLAFDKIDRELDAAD